MFPVIYEIDDETGEATGTVHFFCCDGCRDRAEGPDQPGVSHSYGENSAAEVPTGTVCEAFRCGNPLQPATA